MVEKEERLKNAVNYSGFPLQIRLESEIIKTYSEHSWGVVAKEHAWQNSETGSNGFIDLIIEQWYNRDKIDIPNSITNKMIIECKRSLDANWIFLVPDNKKAKEINTKAWHTKLQKDFNQTPQSYYWMEAKIYPESHQSEFCIISENTPDNSRGKKRNPVLIERILGPLIESTESFAEEDLKLLQRDPESYKKGHKFYFNVVVTTADLSVCEFDPEDITLDNGSLDEACFTSVPYIRFRKQLSTGNIAKTPKTSYENQFRLLKNERENTAFIVNASHFIDFLGKFEHFHMTAYL